MVFPAVINCYVSIVLLFDLVLAVAIVHGIADRGVYSFLAEFNTAVAIFGSEARDVLDSGA